MPIRTIPGTDWKYALICHDAEGTERPEDGTLISAEARKLLSSADAPITDVFVMSHGWMGDVPAAIAQYDSWSAVAAGCADDLEQARTKRPGFRPLVVGLHWPSLPWGDEDIPPGAVAFDDVALIRRVVDRYVEALGDTPSARAAVEVIVARAIEDPEPATMPADVAAAYRVLDARTAPAEGVVAPPGSDRAEMDPEATYQMARTLESDVDFGSFGLGALLAPLRVLSFWKMKDRGRSFGEGGAHALARTLQQATPDRVRFHAMGHSFGCIVVSGMIAGPPRGAGLSRPFHSAFLAQGAVSLWAYCADIPHAPGGAGYFHRLISRGAAKYVVTTQSRFDTAVGTMYPLAAGVSDAVDFVPEFPKYGGIGTFGIQGGGIEVASSEMLPATAKYQLAPGMIHNLKADRYVKDGGGTSGAHSDIAKPAVAHAMWSAALA